jgi:dipeptidyl aminopeptidase/acylaminoacyl peptidase
VTYLQEVDVTAGSVAFAAVVSLAVPALAATDKPDGSLIVRPTAVQLPDYAAAKGIDRSATRAEYDEARHDRRFVLERFTYASDGLEVSAYLYRPAASRGPSPLVVFIRGSFIVSDQAPLLVTMFHRLARAGFVVVAPMLRGSDGMEGHVEMGGADLHDVGNVITAAASLGLAAAHATFLYGESRGGIMTLLALKNGLSVRAAATFGAITDIDAYLAADEGAAALATRIWPDFATNRAQITAARSAQRWSEQITKPLLLMHGAKDPQVHVSHTVRLAEALARTGTRYAVRIFDDDGHTLFRSRVERDRTATEFFRQFVPEAR